MAAKTEDFDMEALRDKSWPWWYPNFDSKLTDEGRQLLIQCGIAPEKVDSHVKLIRDKAWNIFPFPCIGQYNFLEFGISRHPDFNKIIQLLKEPLPATYEPPPTRPNGVVLDPSRSQQDRILSKIVENPSQRRLLDVGTCLGQDLRMLRHSGVPTSSLYGSDIFEGFEAVGQELFNDGDSFIDRFFIADIFDESSSNAFKVTAGLWDVLTVTMFFHQFDLEKQHRIAVKLIRMLRATKGSMLIGYNTGQLQPGEIALRPPFCRAGENMLVYRHNTDTTKVMLEGALATVTGGEDKWQGDWRISCQYDEVDLELKREAAAKGKEGALFFQGDGQRRVIWAVEHL